MIHILKNEVEEKFGTKIQNRGDCELLSNVILDVLNIDLSYNTIRRLYGLAPTTKPNSKTLNSLSKFIGYESYIHFTQNFNRNERKKISQYVYETFNNSDDNEIIALVRKIKRSGSDFPYFVVLLTRELFHDNNFKLINRLFNLKELNYHSFSYSEILFVGNSIGILFRKKEFFDSELLRNINFIRCVFLTFVDYSSINSYYGEWARFINQEVDDVEIKLFTSAILQFKNLLNNQNITNSFKNEPYDISINPILRSRLMSVKIYNKSPTQITKALGKYRKNHKDKVWSIDYYFELIYYSILVRSTTLMKHIIDLNSSNQGLTLSYQIKHLNSFYLMCAFYYKLHRERTEQLKFYKLYKKEDSWYSYKDYLRIIQLVYIYNEARESAGKKEVLNEYTTISNRMNYPYFSKDYLFKYFKV